MNVARIPLFPLSLVLFPGHAVPLHIFEPRYREMTRHCIETESPFGIIFVHDERTAETGCSALIVKTLKEYPDGRSDILVVGQNAFRLTRTISEKSYLEADVEYLDDEPGEADVSQTDRVSDLCNRCHRVLYGEDAPPFESEPGASFSFHVASELPLEPEFRQRLLEQRSEAERQQLLEQRLTEWYPQLQERDRLRNKAGGNGHGKL